MLQKYRRILPGERGRPNWAPSLWIHPGPVCRLGKQVLDHRPVTNNHHGTTGIGMVFLGMVDTETMVEGGSNVIRRKTFCRRQGCLVVTFTQHPSTLDSSTCHQHEHAAGIVVTTTLGRSLVDLGSSAKLASDINHGRHEPSILGQPGKHAGKPFVEWWQQVVLEPAEVIFVGIPATCGERHKTNPRFHQSRCQKATLPKR